MKALLHIIKVLVLPLLICGIESGGAYAQTLNISKSVYNATTGGDGTAASQNDVLVYTISVKNLSANNFTNALLYDAIPAGTLYVAGSTTLNGVAVADVSGKMPYSNTGGLINSALYTAGTLAPNAAAVVTFMVTVTANGGTITNYGTVSATYNGASVVQNTNTVFTNLTPDPSCSTIYEITSSTTSGGVPYRYFRAMSSTDGTGGAVIYNGSNGPCYNAINGHSLSSGSLISSTSGTAAIAYDKNTNRIYFVNNSTAQDLGYIDLNASPVCARSFVGYPLETNTNSGYNINRMAFASDGYGYAVTSNGRDLIQFSINTTTNLPVINRLGTLSNDASNGTNDILSESGGDIFGDGSGKLYLVANSSNMYKINPATRVATFMGSVNPFPGTSQSMAVDAAGNVYIGGAYQNVYKINLLTMAATSITSGTSNIYTSGDYTSCAFPVLASAITANKSYKDIRGNVGVIGGDTIEYTIAVTNTGNINAAGVKLYDYIPASTNYVSNSATLNGSPVADVSGAMPFSVTGGRLVNSPGEQGGIIKPGAAYRAVVKFRVKIDPLQHICNQSKITLLDVDGNTIFVNSTDTTQAGTQTPTCFYSDGLLAANALQFKGSLKSDVSVLQWSATDDANVAYYEVEYAENGVSFTTTGKVAGKQNGVVTNNYQFTDRAHTLSPVRYYRIKLVQKGGSVTYSGIIRLAAQGGDIQVLPNPFDQQLNVLVNVKTREAIRIRLVDFYGRTVYSSAEQLNAGSNSINIIVPPGLPKGMYVLEVLNANQQLYQKKLLKK